MPHFYSIDDLDGDISTDASLKLRSADLLEVELMDTTATLDTSGALTTSPTKGGDAAVLFKGGIDAYTDGEDSHDGYPGGRTSSTEVHGTGDDDVIDHSGGVFQQHIYGFAGDDEIWAGETHDHVFGGLGNDSIFGGGGHDVVVGQDGDDMLFGQNGMDQIHAGAGEDSIFGGYHDDIIFLTDDGQTDSIYFAPGDGADIVKNFEHGHDQIGLGGFGFSDFSDIAGQITYNDDGTQAILDLGGGDQITFTNLEEALDAGDFLF